MLHVRVSARPPVDWLGTFEPQSQIWNPVLKHPETGGSVQQKKEVPHHACWEVKSHHTSSHLSIAVLSPKDSHYSSAHFFIATGYKKRLVTSESCQIQGLSSEATIMTITDFKSKVALIQIYHTLDAPGGGRNQALWKSTDCS